MELFVTYLQNLGIVVQVDENSSPFVKFILVLLMLSTICFLCLINITLYFVIYNFRESEKVLNIVSKHKLLLKMFNLYKKTSFYYLLSEFMFLYVNLGIIIYFCFMIVTGNRF